MLYCKNCGAMVERTFRFCEKCFADLSIEGAVVDNVGRTSDAAEKAVQSGDFLAEAFTADHDLSGYRIGGYRLCEKIGSFLGDDHYSAVNISDGTEASVRYIHINGAECSDRAEILCGRCLDGAVERAAKICADECTRFGDICKSTGVGCPAFSAESYISSDRKEGHIFIISDKCSPLPLEMRRKSFTVRDIIKIASGICGHISEFERSNIVYNSIFEANTVIDTNGRPMLCAEIDRAMQKSFILTSAAQAYSIYLPPDLRHDEQCGVYSLAVMLYRLLNGGKPPYINYFNDKCDYSDLLCAEQKRNSFLELQLPINAENMLGNMLCGIIGNRNWRSVRISDVRNTLDNALNYLSSSELDRKIN